MTLFRNIVAAASFALVAQAGPAAAQVDLTIGHTLMPDTHYQAFAEKFKELVEERTNGEVTVSIFGQSQLGGEVRMLQSVRSGAQSIVITASAPMENSVPEYAVFAAPYLFNDLEEANKLLQGSFGDHMLGYLPDHGYKPLGFITAIERDVYTSSKPIRQASDMQNVKVRVIQSPAYVDTYQALGAQPTPMNYAEVYIALQNGVVDGAENSPDVFVSDRHSEVSKYFNLTKIHFMPALIVMSPEHFNRLDEEQQLIVVEAADEARAHAIQFYLKGYASALDKAREAGIEIVESDLESFKDATADVARRLIESTPRGAESEAALEKARAALQ